MTIKSLLIFLCFSVCSLAFAAPKTTLFVQPHTIEVDGQPESVYRVVQSDGTWGYTGIEGEMFEARVANQTDKPISMHWHGIVLPASGCFRSCASTPVKPTLGFASHGWGLALLFGTLGVSLASTTPNPSAS